MLLLAEFDLITELALCLRDKKRFLQVLVEHNNCFFWVLEGTHEIIQRESIAQISVILFFLFLTNFAFS